MGTTIDIEDDSLFYKIGKTGSIINIVSGKISVFCQQEENCYPPFSEGNYHQEGRMKNEPI